MDYASVLTKRAGSASVDWSIPPPATDWKNELKYYAKGLKHLPAAFKETIADSAHDSAIAVPRGIVRGTNLVVQPVAGELRGLSDYGTRLINDTVDKHISAPKRDTVKRVLTAPTKQISKGLRKAQDAGNYATNAFLDYYRYKDPTNIGAKVAEGAGTLMPATYAIGKLGLNAGSRLFAPVRVSDATGLARLIPTLGRSKALAITDSVLSSPAYNIGTNALVSGVPLVDYVTGFSHQNPDDSNAVRQFKEFGAKLPIIGSALNPAAYINYKINRSLPKMLPRMEYSGRALGDAGAVIFNPEDSALRSGLPAAKTYLKEHVTDPSFMDPYGQYAVDSAKDLWNYGPRGMAERQPRRQLELKDTLRNGPSEALYRWTGIQPGIRPPGADKGYTLQERLAIGKAVGRGLKSSLQSTDNRTAVFGNDAESFYASAKQVWDQASQYHTVGNTEDATAIVIQNMPGLITQFLNIIHNNQ